MERSDWLTAVVVILVAVLLLGSGPLAGGLLQPSGTPTTLGDGDVEVGVVDVSTTEFVLTPGRFGTAVTYLRVPDAAVQLASVTDRPRLVYRVQVPALGVDRTVSTVVTDRGQHRLHLRAQALEPGTVEEDEYTGTVRVRVQSFSTDRTLYRQDVTIEVKR